MGEAIAAFRKYALRARESLDVWRFEAECDYTLRDQEDPDYPCAYNDWYEDVIWDVNDILSDRRPLVDYVTRLLALQERFERLYPGPLEDQLPPPEPEGKERKGFRISASPQQWFYADRRRGRAALRALANDAVREAVQWSALAERVEEYVRRLFEATDGMVHSVAMTYSTERISFSDYQRVSRKQTRNLSPVGDYVALLEEWFDAFDWLAPFEGEPADKASSSAAEKAEEEFPTRRSGRPVNDERLACELVAGWDSFEPEKGRPLKEDYLASRPEVQALKSGEARKKRITELKRALNTALALRNERLKSERKSPRRN